MVQSHTEQASTPSDQDGVENDAPKMDAALKAKWIEALRSGKYAQTIGCLHDDIGFCCLGVLCDISGEGQWRQEGDRRNRYDIGGEPGARAVLPRIFIRKYAVDNVGPLIEMNDTRQPFSAIADYIEQNL